MYLITDTELFSLARGSISRSNGIKLRQGKIRLNIRENSLAMRFITMGPKGSVGHCFASDTANEVKPIFRKLPR